MDSPVKLPIHIERLTRELKQNTNTEKVLLDHLPDTSRDTSLYQVYLRLGYSSSKAGFQQTPTRLQVLQLISEEFGITQVDELDHADLKLEFFRTFNENQIGQFSSPASLGLSPATTANEPSQSAHDCNSLMDYWGNITPQKPFRMEVEFETPSKFFDLEARSSKGLRSVSLRVKEILRQKGKSSYRDIADVLVHQLELPAWADKPKEEKNIRRRVYDALNVLIAAGVMSRDGRDILMLRADASNPTDDDEELKQIKLSVMQKRQKLRDLAYNSMSLKQLFARNKNQETSERIDFPFIVLATEDSADNRLSISSSPTCRKIRMSFVKEAFSIGDSDIVKMLRFQRPWNTDALPSVVRQLLNDTAVCLFT